MGIPTVGPTFYSNLRMTNRNKGRIIESLASILLGAGSGAAEEEHFEIPPEAMKPGSKASVVQQRLNEQKASWHLDRRNIRWSEADEAKLRELCAAGQIKYQGNTAASWAAIAKDHYPGRTGTAVKEVSGMKNGQAPRGAISTNKGTATSRNGANHGPGRYAGLTLASDNDQAPREVSPELQAHTCIKGTYCILSGSFSKVNNISG